ncbi:hypothetical protein SASPL_129630 [Salvia splendens]|uniref:Uncharacterized protein n=1 Tax=Salvia splendens TaxID=180675 RepID=A0A8X8XES4_SALSN|nr:uncharacterized protein LOC121750688 [Salvia splendens]KAG6411547.1 hypothetical protein SASPL_129630 [Salvia splendens]
MSKSSRLDLHDADSEALGLLDSASFPSEPPNIRNWFSSYVYESPELDSLSCFQDFDGAGDTCRKEEITGKFGDNHPTVSAKQMKPCDDVIESNGFDDSGCCESGAAVSGSSESLSFPSEPPCIGNWFSSYVYESPPLDTALDFAISDCEEREYDKLDVVEKSARQNIKDSMASTDVKKSELCALNNTSDAVVKGPNIGKGTKLDYQSMCKEDDNDVMLQALPSIPSLSRPDKVSKPMLFGQKVGYSNYPSLEKIGSTNAHDNDYDAELHCKFSSRNPISFSIGKNICSQEEITGKFGNNHPAASSKQVKPSHGIESNGSDDSGCCKSAAMVSGSSESLSFPSEPPCIGNWFSSYVYESPPLDTALDFAISDCEEREYDKIDVVEKSASQNIKDSMVSRDVKKPELCALNNTSDAVVKGPNIGKGTKLDYQSMCKEDGDDVMLQALPSIPSLSRSDKVSKPTLFGQKAGYSNYQSLKKKGSTNARDNDYDAESHRNFSSGNPISFSIEKNIGSQDERSVHRQVKGTVHVNDDQGNKVINKIVSPRTIDRGGQADRSTWKENKVTELQERGFISVRKRNHQEDAENVARLRVKVEPSINVEKDDSIVRKALSEISNFHSGNKVATTGKWCCPKRNKPDLGPPLKQLRLDQWVRRV